MKCNRGPGSHLNTSGFPVLSPAPPITFLDPVPPNHFRTQLNHKTISGRLKMSENLWLSDVFWAQRKGKLTRIWSSAKPYFKYVSIHKKNIFQRSEDIVVIHKYCYKTYINLKSTGTHWSCSKNTEKYNKTFPYENLSCQYFVVALIWKMRFLNTFILILSFHIDHLFLNFSIFIVWHFFL